MSVAPAVSSGAQRWLTDPIESGAAAGFGVYLHVPFCSHRCGYCDFATDAVGGRDDTDALFSRYVTALRDDLARQVAAGRRAHAPARRGPQLDDAWPTVTSVFVGGGTPTLLPPDLLAAVVRGVSDELDVAPDAEITVECNPETADEELFGALVEAGVTRISMGAQSFTPSVLATLERGHSAERPVEAVRQARAAGIDEVNLDLIFGTPGETDEDWRETLRAVVAAGTDHVSAYALTIHDSTPFGRAIARGAMPSPDEDVQADRFDAARELLGGSGFEHYEVSNWALGSARRSRHNLLYWRHGDYLALGVGAHGHLAGRRWWTTRSTARYLAAVEAGMSPVSGAEDLDVDEQAEERLLLGLRVREGLHPADVPAIDPLALEDALDAGLVTTACGRLQCTEQGWFLLDEAVRRLV
ncbi:radical SAM family heme chaperone HemW [Egicoccus halophilus]|uniref:Heme chaperone HemW n=1 Tax=Egicoccus halophilus TaxID=1670830 RepID=A0A8J3EUV6_9ACTN|nr:radical SAM family heme chaperone HemW [Egicoccus halophilus]GGI08448.1 coproporphyrinogen III oxidase [Egicoccus halophilus]